MSAQPIAGLERRFYAFALDRTVAWAIDAGAAYAAWRYLIDPGQVLAGVLVIVGTVLLVGLVFSLLLGLTGVSPGNAAVGIRVVREGTGGPIGVGRALLRQLILGIAGLPTFGLGVATLAWTAMMDPSGRRRGWHDHVARSVVVDIHPVDQEAPEPDAGPRHVVNLTALRLVPAPPPSQVVPPRAPKPSAPPPGYQPAPSVPARRSAEQPEPGPAPAVPAAPVPAAVSAAAATTATTAPAVEPAVRAPARQQLGYPLVPEPRPDAVEEPARPTGGAHAARAPEPDPQTRWRVSFDSGETFVVDGQVLVGRRPEPRNGEQPHHVVPLRSEDMSLSKTHAQVQLAADGALVVMDRGSTNGSVLVRHGVPRQLTAGKPATLVDGDVVRFGDRTMTVAREA